jgi:hypothetical protein
MQIRVMGWLAGLFLSVSQAAVAQAAHPFAEVAQGLLQAHGDRRVLIIGEMRGTAEIPALLATLARQMSESGPVIVGLEVPAQEQLRFAAYLDSDGGLDARTHLLAGDFWKAPQERSDGRRSGAMLQLLEALRELRAGGAPLSVVGFDDRDFYGKDKDKDRDRLMAESLLALHRSHPQARLLVLTGNYHARLVAPARVVLEWGPAPPPREPMASHLRGIALTTVNVSARSGAFWACMGGQCGIQPLPARVGKEAGEIALKALPADSAGYHLQITLPRFTASEPVAPD